MANAAPRSSRGTGGSFDRSLLRPYLSLPPAENDPPSDLVRDHDGQDQEPLQDDDNLPGQVAHQSESILPAVQQAEGDRRHHDAKRTVAPEERHRDPGET